MAREALIVDVRGNRGGHTSQLVIEKLARRVIGWDLPRGHAPVHLPARTPRAGRWSRSPTSTPAPTATSSPPPSRSSTSGPVVGTRTWGGVIGIDGRYRLVDGTDDHRAALRVLVRGLGWGVENYGVDPDVEVVITPDDWAAGRDPQLEEAVRLALAALEERPAATPPDPATRPSRRRPALPPRP